MIIAVVTNISINQTDYDDLKPILYGTAISLNLTIIKISLTETNSKLLNLYKSLKFNCLWQRLGVGVITDNKNTQQIYSKYLTDAHFDITSKTIFCNVPKELSWDSSMLQEKMGGNKLLLFITANKIIASKAIDMYIYPNIIIGDIFPKSSKYLFSPVYLLII